MVSSRAVDLLRELMQEVGVAGALLPTMDGGLEAQLSLDVSDIPEEELQDIFLGALAYSSAPDSKKRKVQPEDDEEEADQEGSDGQELAVPDGDTLDEQELLKMYNEKSGRQCFKERPDVFTTKGKFKKEYAYIAAGNKKPKLGGPGGSNGRITNRPWVKVVELNGHQIQCGLVETTALPYERLVLVFPRASGAPPTYGLPGMFERGAVAGRAYVALEPSAPAMIISIPRAQVASKWPMSNSGKEEGSKLVEMNQALDAVQNGMRVDLVSIGIDGLTTDVASFSWLHEKWGSRLDIRLVFIVAAHFPGPASVFPVRPNGIRYGIFALADVAAAANNSPSATESSVELVKIIRMVRESKEDRDKGYKGLTSWTAGRANFRVCPSTKHDSGVDEEFFRKTRTLQKNEKE